MDDSDMKQDLRELIANIREKLLSLPAEGAIRTAMTSEKIDELAKRIEKHTPADLEWDKWPPLALFIYRHSLSEIQAFENDINLVVTHSKRTPASQITNYMKAGPEEDRMWAGGIFETFVKSRCLREKRFAVELDFPLPKGRSSDILIAMKEKSFHLECTVITDSDEDREVWERFIEAKKADPEIFLTRPGQFDPPNSKSPSPYYDCLRVYDKVYDKIAKKLDLNKSQLSEDAPNILLISFFSPYRHLSPTSPGVGWALDELFADQPKICADHPSFLNISLLAWLTFTEKRLLQSGVTLNPANDSQWLNKVIAAPRKIGAVLLFDRFSLKASRVNYNAKQECRISHREMAKLEELFAVPPGWESGTT